MASGKGLGLGAISAGAIFIYGGLKGYSPLKAILNIIQAKPASAGQSPNALTQGGINNSGANSSSATSAGGGMPARASYDHSSLMQLWISNGGSPSTANNAACHAMQESSGNPKVTSNNPDGGTNVGLWQLDTRGVGSGHSVAELQDPNTNARITIQATGNGRNWAEWATPGC